MSTSLRAARILFTVGLSLASARLGNGRVAAADGPLGGTVELILYEQHMHGAVRFAALVKDPAGVWRRTCDRTAGIEHPVQGDLIQGRVTVRHEQATGADAAVCQVDVLARSAASSHRFLLFAPPALGPFAAGMPAAAISGLLGKTVPNDTTARTHLRSGAYELQMSRGHLAFVSARLSALAGPMITPDRPTLDSSASFTLAGATQPVDKASVFRPTLPPSQALRFAKLRYSNEILGGAADLRPLAADFLLFTNHPLRAPAQRAHLRAALIGLYRSGLRWPPPLPAKP